MGWVYIGVVEEELGVRSGMGFGVQGLTRLNVEWLGVKRHSSVGKGGVDSDWMCRH